MKEQIYNDARAALQQLADALGIAAEHLWAILVKQQIVESFTGLFFIFLFIISIFVMKFFYNLMEKGRITGSGYNSGDYRASNVTFFIVFLTISLVVFIISLVYTPNIINGFINPEYGAFREIKSILK